MTQSTTFSLHLFSSSTGQFSFNYFNWFTITGYFDQSVQLFVHPIVNPCFLSPLTSFHCYCFFPSHFTFSLLILVWVDMFEVSWCNFQPPFNSIASPHFVLQLDRQLQKKAFNAFNFDECLYVARTRYVQCLSLKWFVDEEETSKNKRES